MTLKKVLVAGATGLVGYAAMKHFAQEPGAEAIAVSRRRPDETFGARWLPLDLTDAAACAKLAPEFTGDMAALLDPKQGMKSREVAGGTGSNAVAAAMDAARQRLNEMTTV